MIATRSCPSNSWRHWMRGCMTGCIATSDSETGAIGVTSNGISAPSCRIDFFRLIVFPSNHHICAPQSQVFSGGQQPMDATQNMSPLNQTNCLLNFLRFDNPRVLAKVRGHGLCLVTPSMAKAKYVMVQQQRLKPTADLIQCSAI